MSPNSVPFHPLRNPEAATAPAEVTRLPEDPCLGAEQRRCDCHSLQLQLREVTGQGQAGEALASKQAPLPARPQGAIGLEQSLKHDLTGMVGGRSVSAQSLRPAV